MASEIEVMGTIDKAMSGLSTDEAKRVLRWAVDKFGDDGIGLKDDGVDRRQDRVRETYERISDLMDAASPATIVDHVLVASYWFQAIKGQENFTGQEVNSELKDLGHPSSNITDSYNTLISRKPPAVRQVQKTGASRQARKKYRLTEVGIREVERMLRGQPTD